MSTTTAKPTTTNPTLSDKEFLSQFQYCTLPVTAFNHRGHLRLAWLMLNQYPTQEAVEKVCRGILAYATHLGVPGKFNHTLTAAVMLIMKARLSSMSPQEDDSIDAFEIFLANNQDLVSDLMGVLNHHYSPELLHSPAAAKDFVAPDRLPLPVSLESEQAEV